MFSSQLATMVFSEHKVETYWLLMLCCTSQLIWYSLLIAYVILATQSIYEICMRVALLLQQTLWFNYSLLYSALHMVKWNLPEINQSKNSTCMLASFFFVLQLSQWYTEVCNEVYLKSCKCMIVCKDLIVIAANSVFRAWRFKLRALRLISMHAVTSSPTPSLI